MFTYLVILFTVLPALELVLLIKVGSHIGALTTVMIIMFTGIWGAYLARLQGFYILKNIQANLEKGLMPSSELMDGLMVLVGGVLLLTPGFITDTIGFFLLIPVTRALIKRILESKFQQMIAKGHIVRSSGFPPNNQQYDDIDIN